MVITVKTTPQGTHVECVEYDRKVDNQELAQLRRAIPDIGERPTTQQEQENEQ